jgi:hypothetical protein
MNAPMPVDDALLEATPRFAVELYREALPEMRTLYDAHWREIALDHEKIKLEPDYEAYDYLAERGALHLVTARMGWELIGYHLSIIRPHLHYKSSLTCFTDVFYLRPEYRTGMTGYKMLKFFRDSVRARGVQKVYMMTKIAHDIDPLMRRLGFKAIERVYSMVF